jgi:hypothetical protein
MKPSVNIEGFVFDKMNFFELNYESLCIFIGVALFN